MIPVILIHKKLDYVNKHGFDYDKYLDCCINQALKQNEVWVLSDTELPKKDGLTVFQHKDYFEDCDRFRSVYTHLTTSDIEFEIFCFQRWILLKNLMQKNNVPVTFHIDSDVLFFENAQKEWEKYNQYDMTVVNRCAGVSSFVTLDGIENFCSLMIACYENQESYEFKKIASHYLVRNSCGLGGGVCDMTFLDFFHSGSCGGGGPGRVGEMLQIINDSVYDHNINDSDQGFEMENGLKKVKSVNGSPYVYNERLKKEIKFNSLHMSGDAKKRIPEYYERFSG